MPRDSYEDVSDEALLVAYANGDPATARALTIRLTPRVFGHAYRLLGNRADAEDITQEALIRLWKFAPEWRQGEAKVSTWLYKVVANLCTDRLRRGSSVDLESVPDPEDSSLSAVEQMQQRARLNGLQQGLNALPERQRQAVVLRHIEGLSNPEIAEIMGAGVEAVESLTARGKRALTTILAKRKEELGYTDG